MSTQSRHKPTKRSKRSIIQETRRVAVRAMAIWLLATVMLVGIGLRTGEPLVPQGEVKTASLLKLGEVASSFSQWWSVGGESSNDAAVIAPTTSPAPLAHQYVDAYAKRLATLPNDVSSTNQIFLPILYYHDVPPDFDEQLTYLEDHGYNVIGMDEAVAGLAGAPLPDRPVTITFDDGFAGQTAAVPILKEHRMTATFYIINGGPDSNWCIGAGRRFGDPAQPLGGCGDDYLNWQQIRELDRSGVATIGGHTLDHADLASLDSANQWREIADSKNDIEKQLGHPIHHFAYPYGAYTSETIAQVKLAGYVSAVTTQVGTDQTYGARYELKRIRTALALPN